MKSRLIGHIILALCIAELALILISWLLSATETEGVHSLLSAEGIRWFFGNFVNVQRHQLLIWIILLAIAWGPFSQCGILQRTKTKDFRSQLARRVAIGFSIVYTILILLLILPPHALLLSATGGLWPSAFSHSIIPIISFYILFVGISYGIITNNFHSLSSVVDAMCLGIKKTAPLLVLYIFAMFFWASLLYVISFQ